ncbi:MAG TPA: hypothetical protein VII12_17685, partial [Thermoanaerobaculia bacterium]
MQVIFPERRRAKRYLTLKNAAIAVIGPVVAFLLLSVWSAFPHSAVSGMLFPFRGHSSDSATIRHDP